MPPYPNPLPPQRRPQIQTREPGVSPGQPFQSAVAPSLSPHPMTITSSHLRSWVAILTLALCAANDTNAQQPAPLKSRPDSTRRVVDTVKVTGRIDELIGSARSASEGRVGAPASECTERVQQSRGRHSVLLCVAFAGRGCGRCRECAFPSGGAAAGAGVVGVEVLSRIEKGQHSVSSPGRQNSSHPQNCSPLFSRCSLPTARIRDHIL